MHEAPRYRLWSWAQIYATSSERVFLGQHNMILYEPAQFDHPFAMLLASSGAS